MKLELHATPEEVMRAVQAVQDFGRQKHLAEKVIFGLALALEESGSNVVNHALHGDPAQKFQVSIEHTGSAVIIELRDRGPAFDPTQLQVPEPAEGHDRLPGGWGIQLVRRYMDQILYRREGDENVLRLTKQVAPVARE
jgi:serine/threonine-protein kinase RsbW